jgi:hypothetical protein
MGITSLMNDDDKSPIRNYIVPGMQGVVEHGIVIVAYGFAKFVINIERDPTFEWDPEKSSNRKHKIPGYSLNPRAYEIALCGGGLQLIDEQRPEIFDKGVLEPGVHCVTYKSPEDMVDKIRYYMEHEDERQKIVKAARAHALMNHTYLCRAKRMLDIINWKEGRKEGVAREALQKLMVGKGNFK